MPDLITLEIDEGLAIVTLGRPQSGNAMNWELIDQLADASEQLIGDETVRAVLIRAEGKNFCVGGDLNSFATEADPPQFITDLANRLHVAIRNLTRLSAPVVIAVQGAAAGAGLSLVASGDIVLCGPEASFSMAYTGIGLTADGGATWLLPRLIGLRRAQEMAYANRRLSASEALEYGLVTQVVEAGTLADEALARARAIAAGPTAAYGAVKALFADGALATLDDHLDAEATAIGVALGSEDAKGAVKAFLAREKPVFKGR